MVDCFFEQSEDEANIAGERLYATHRRVFDDEDFQHVGASSLRASNEGDTRATSPQFAAERFQFGGSLLSELFPCLQLPLKPVLFRRAQRFEGSGDGLL